ncbi:MAG: LCP family protein, partial [Frankiaceae bacterium]|nr:LCP family protein [Frankiaceae bacterium]
MSMPPAPGRRSRTRRILKWVAISVATVLVITVAGAYVVYLHLNGNLTTFSPRDCKHHKTCIVIPEPKKVGKAQNILLIGSDTRAFAGSAKYGRLVAGARSDTAILVHLGAGASKAILVSIPRDSYVEIPKCRRPDGSVSGPQHNKFNAAYAIGGPACTIATVESLTNIHIDHFVEVNFAGFKNMVNALGGVTVCVPQAINDPIVRTANGFHGSGLVLPAGNDHLNGEQALGYVRARYSLGDGSDLGRIKRQQAFLSAVVRKATSTGLLLNPTGLYSFLNAATKSVQTDPGFGLFQLKDLAGRLHGLKPGKVVMLTVPLSDTNAYRDIGGANASVVIWDDQRASLLWNALRTDGPLPGTAPRPSPSPSGTATPSPNAPTLIVAPSHIHVRVLNGTGQKGIAHTVADALAAEGFDIVGIGDADSSSYSTTFVRYGTTKNESSETLAAAVPGSDRQLDGSLGSVLQLVVGSNYSGVVPVQISSSGVPTPSPSPTATLDTVTADR